MIFKVRGKMFCFIVMPLLLISPVALKMISAADAIINDRIIMHMFLPRLTKKASLLPAPQRRSMVRSNLHSSDVMILRLTMPIITAIDIIYSKEQNSKS